MTHPLLDKPVSFTDDIILSAYFSPIQYRRLHSDSLPCRYLAAAFRLMRTIVRSYVEREPTEYVSLPFLDPLHYIELSTFAE